jgi:hypothetical protein
MTELTTVQAVDHHTAKLNGTWLYRAAAAQEPGVIYGSHVHPDLPGGTAQPSEGEAPWRHPHPPTVNQNDHLAAAAYLMKHPSSEQESSIMPEFTIGNYLATRLEQIGIKHYFMVPGDYNLVLLDQLLANKNMEQVGCCNELNASYAAEAYARVNGCGAVLATMNVGSFSALNGVAGAYAERLPVIFVASGYNTNDASTILRSRRWLSRLIQ